jgi:hypothetical protein
MHEGCPAAMKWSPNGSGKALLGAAGVGAGIALLNMLRRTRLSGILKMQWAPCFGEPFTRRCW